MTFKGEEGLLKSRGVRVGVLHESLCIAPMMRFVQEEPEFWYEDIGKEMHRKGS